MEMQRMDQIVIVWQKQVFCYRCEIGQELKLIDFVIQQLWKRELHLDWLARIAFKDFFGPELGQFFDDAVQFVYQSTAKRKAA